MQANNVTPELFDAGGERLPVGQPAAEDRGLLGRVRRADHEEPALVLGRGRQAGHQRRRRQLLRRRARARSASTWSRRRRPARLGSAVTYDKLNEVQDCLSNDKTVDQGPGVEVQLPAELGQQDPVPVPERQQVPQPPRRQLDHARRKRPRSRRATRRGASRCPTHSLTHTLILTDKLVFNNQFTYVGGGFFLDYQDVPPQGALRAEPVHRRNAADVRLRYAQRPAGLPVERAAA